MDLDFYQIELSSVYHPCLDWLKCIKETFHKLTFTKAHLLIEMHYRWLPHEAGWENAKSVQSCHQGKGWLLWRISCVIYFHLLNNFLVNTEESLPCVISLLYNVENSTNKEKTLEWVAVSKHLTGTVYKKNIYSYSVSIVNIQIWTKKHLCTFKKFFFYISHAAKPVPQEA
jgi:hypothetical protein